MTQSYDHFEVVVLEQSDEEHWESHRAAFNKFDNRVRVIRSKPVGPAGARNVGTAHCRGDVVLFMDDDDLPVGNNWIAAHAKNYSDPYCIGVSGKQLHKLNEPSRYKDTQRAYERCLTLSFFLRGRVFTGIDVVKKPVQWLHGNNCSLRKSTIAELGGWYPYLKAGGEEHSLYYKFQKMKKPSEYLMFDPEPQVLRRFDIPGGNNRRSLSLHRLLINRMQYYHWVIAEYFPFRFYGLYPLFMLHGFHVSARFFRRKSSFTDVFWIRWLGREHGEYLYVIQEFVIFPFLALWYFLRQKPKWNGRLDEIASRFE